MASHLLLSKIIQKLFLMLSLDSARSERFKNGFICQNRTSRSHFMKKRISVKIGQLAKIAHNSFAYKMVYFLDNFDNKRCDVMMT